jgi:hypothetical protein
MRYAKEPEYSLLTFSVQWGRRAVSRIERRLEGRQDVRYRILVCCAVDRRDSTIDYVLRPGRPSVLLPL